MDRLKAFYFIPISILLSTGTSVNTCYALEAFFLNIYIDKEYYMGVLRLFSNPYYLNGSTFEKLIIHGASINVV
jgi:hypothetical protein